MRLEQTIANMTRSPFPREPAVEVPLPEAPLLRVVAQIRFSAIASLTRMEFIAPFQEALREAYPTMVEQRGMQVMFGPDGVSQVAGDREWRLIDEDESWIVVLGPSFVSLETTQYSSRDDFVDRISTIAGALRSVVGDVQVERIGVRYTDRLTGEYATTSLPRLVRPEVLGLSAGSLDTATVRAAVTQAEFELADGSTMTTRWGLLPPGNTLTPDIQAVDEPSWVLDLDAAAVQLRLSEDVVRDAAERLCIHAYDFFRWAVTDDFIRVHGGDPGE